MGLSHQLGRGAALRLWLRAPAALPADHTNRPIKPKLLHIFPLAGTPLLTDQPNLLVGQMLRAESSDPLRLAVGDTHPSAAKRAVSLPLRPQRQLRVRHVAFFSIVCAGTGGTSGMCRLRGLP
jgi:hypothetical protein